MNKLFKTPCAAATVICLCTFFLLQGCSNPSDDQANQAIIGHGTTDVKPFFNKNVFQTLSFRNIGPYRGGRSLAVAGTAGDPQIYYAGFTGGGVYKTVDAGKSWFNVSDGYFKTGSVGAIAVSQSNPGVVYVGMGETDIRGEITFGDGIYKSTDAGKTWKWAGLSKTHAIGQIAIHPANPDIVYVAAMGKIYGKEGNKERGIFKTTDGGKTWKKVLYNGPHLGGDYVEIDPNNTDVIYASLWNAYRMPWQLSSGGKNGSNYKSGLYKSTDAGKTWDLISDNPGMATGELGKMEIVVSPTNSNRLYALVEAEDGGLFRSDDAGQTWQLVNGEKSMTRRAWYFVHLQADPNDPNTIYVEDGPLRKSVDGGKTFHTIDTPHWDIHDMWIDPNNPKQMIVGDDGGAQVSLDGGTTWTSYYVYSTAQVYKVSTDNRFPYHVYGAQIDNTALVMKNRTSGKGITREDWSPITYSKTERGYLTPETFRNPTVPFEGGDKGRILQLVKYKSLRNVSNITPENTSGNDDSDEPFRIQSSYPIYSFYYKPDAVFATTQYVLASHDLGRSWERISPDLTRNEKEKRTDTGKHLTSPRTYNSISTLQVSPVDTDVLWAGADDGLIYVSKDNGQTWINVTPPALKATNDRARINKIKASPFEAGGVYIAAFRYEQGHYQPLLFKTKDYGQSWTKIIKGIPSNNFTYVVTPDQTRRGLLFAGTEGGLYISFNDGGKWQPFQLNLPQVPVTDMVISRRDNDLVLATKGRGFYILDELNVLEQITDATIDSKAFLFAAAPAYKLGENTESENERDGVIGQNPGRGPNIYYYLNGVNNNAKVQLQFLKKNHVVKTFSDEKAHKGLNTFSWNMLLPNGQEVESGTYTVRLVINEKSIMEKPFEIRNDPRTTP